mmetsp:Transcript_8671/g.11483  ORF Transcript_8671/g.11483 Transcript_8671/m.11483 type:complete len:331 (+) Transcript_8671:181-1173(+)|eukprot:CAMPEP_0198155512 /NCGR_PEP_ID=MMETSP1443-20131203/69172_1 /TAXON_ID=186043 /ORGANISM="Entomoneis sp., Strain CCMP2396" /LENGTH=330 /DNA_ID=CAMNT_0043822263 /DNA_START=101 /DNA_END=1093 /DNA_ORIENTATION=-
MTISSRLGFSKKNALIAAAFWLLLKSNGIAARSEKSLFTRPAVLKTSGGGPAAALSAKAPARHVVPWNPASSRQQSPQQQNNNDGQISAKEAMGAFLTRESRNTFISRVYAILAGQLAVTCLSIFAFGKYDFAGKWMQRGWGAAAGVSLLLSTIAWFAMFSYPNARRANPLKWQLLALFTVGEAVSVGFLTSFFKFQSVITAMMTTAGATGAVSLYTILNRNSKYDLSQWGAGLASAGVMFLMYGMLQFLEIVGIIPKGFLPLTDAMYSACGATLFSLYLAHHTRMIVSGKHTKYQMNEDDYVYGAVTLFNDVINIFIYLLKILGEEKNH